MDPHAPIHQSRFVPQGPGRRRLHVALAVRDLQATITDYSARLGAEPVAVVPAKYALWRTPEVNLSVNADGDPTQPLRHLGFEDDSVTETTMETDVNGLRWESFHPRWQQESITTAYGSPR